MPAQTLFHVTPKRLLGAIRAKGLLPQIGPRASDAGETRAAVFCFPNRHDLDNALSNWLGEAFEEEDGELVILELAVDRTARRSDDAASYEVAILDPIPESALVAAFSENWDCILEMPPPDASALTHPYHREDCPR
jgi:hypothetical protein